jgi:hypothetical protein
MAGLLLTYGEFTVKNYGVPLRVGLFAIMACLSGQAISAAIPNAENQGYHFLFIRF